MPQETRSGELSTAAVSMPGMVSAVDSTLGGSLEVRRQATMRPSTVNASARTVELTWTAGGAVERFGFRPDDSVGAWVEELSLDAGAVDLSRLNAGAPLLDAHANWELADIIGVVEEASVDGKSGHARVRFSERAEVEPIWQDVRSGIIRNVSVGYRVMEWRQMPAEGETPRYRAVRWTPHEISLVPIPADAGARIRAAGETPKPRADRSAATLETTMPETVQAPAATDAVETKKMVQPDEAAVRAAAQAATTAERQRIAGINRFADRLGADWARGHIEAGTDIEKVRAEALEKFMAEEAKAPTSTVRAEVTEDGRDRFVRGASDWLMQRAGSARVALGEQKPEPGEFRGMSLLDLARHSLELSGVSTRGLDRSRIAGLALSHRSNINQGTGDFPILLANVMHKVLLGAYDLFPSTWSGWCRTGTVSDFRAHNRYRLGSIANLETVAQFAEVPFKDIPDGEIQSITATTKAIRVGISRQALINDDMSAFNQIPTQLGQAAQRSIEAAAYALLAENAGLGPTMGDSLAFFDAGHANVGTGSAYSVTALDADISLMQVQTGPNGEKIALNPTIVLVPVSLRGTARQINTQQTDPTSSKSSTTMNIVAGQFNSVVASPYLTGTRRYLFADPAIAAAFEVAFLDGMAQPMLEEQPGWSTLGVEWRIVHDWGIGALDYRAGVTNAGTGG